MALRRSGAARVHAPNCFLPLVSPCPGVVTIHDLGASYLLAVGDLRAKKNLGALVSAFGAVRRGAGIPHRLVLAGADAGDGPRLAALAGDAPLTLAGYVGDALLSGAALVGGAEAVRGVRTGAPPAIWSASSRRRWLTRRCWRSRRRGAARAAQFSWERTAAQTSAVYRELL